MKPIEDEKPAETDFEPIELGSVSAETRGIREVPFEMINGTISSRPLAD